MAHFQEFIQGDMNLAVWFTYETNLQGIIAAEICAATVRRQCSDLPTESKSPNFVFRTKQEPIDQRKHSSFRSSSLPLLSLTVLRSFWRKLPRPTDRPTERPNPILPLLFQLFTCQKCPPLIDPLKLCDCESWQSWFDSQFLVLKESLIRDAFTWFYGKTHKTSLDIVNKGFLNHMAWFTV